MMNYENIHEYRILAFGDSNTYGYDPVLDGRYDEDTRWPMALQAMLGTGYRVIEEGLPGRTAVFDDPISEGLSGIQAITPCMMSHAPLDLVLIVLGTNDTKERFGCSAQMISHGIIRLAKKALHTEAWRDEPHVLIVSPAPIVPAYSELKFSKEMGVGCSQKARALPLELKADAEAAGIPFLDAAAIPGVEVSPEDGMHLSPEAHIAMAKGLAQLIRK